MKILRWFIAIAIVAVLSSIGTYYFLNRPQRQGISLTSPATSTPVPTESSEDIIKELTSELNPDNDPNFGGTIDAKEGNYVRGGAGFGGGGYGWYAVKQNGKWKIVEKTQNAPACSIMQKFNFPKSIYQDCRPE
ncbi:MAG: hypothetical protein ABH812_01120 [bacterium]